MRVTILGAGLAGCEAALFLAERGVSVTLWEQKPARHSPAHHGEGLAELVCSNSLKADRLDSASGLLKAEMRLLGSHLLPVADATRVAAGGALAVDRDAFSAGVTKLVSENPNITLKRGEAVQVDENELTLIATGPLTDGAMAEEIARLTGDARLSFYDAAAPIVTAESLDRGRIFAASRYGRGEADYLNCPFNKAEYEAFYAELVKAERAPLHEFDTAAPLAEYALVTLASDAYADRGAPRGSKGTVLQVHSPEAYEVEFLDAEGKSLLVDTVARAELAPRTAEKLTVYEGCMPIEVLAARGADTMRYGPLRPVGLTDPATGHRPWANVQLRRENAAGTLYNLVGFQTNLKFGEQKRVFGMIPGLANAEFARYGVMHRNTFLDSPKVMTGGLCLQKHPNVFFAGQITGFEGYMESAGCGLLAACFLWARGQGRALCAPPMDTMLGALLHYITEPNKNFQPMGANMGLLPPLEAEVRDKRERYLQLAQRAVASMTQWRTQL